MRKLVIFIMLVVLLPTVNGQSIIKDFARDYEEYMHQSGLIHSDVSQNDNILIVNMHVKDLAKLSSISISQASKQIENISFQKELFKSYIKQMLSLGTGVYEKIGVKGIKVYIKKLDDSKIAIGSKYF